MQTYGWLTDELFVRMYELAEFICPKHGFEIVTRALVSFTSLSETQDRRMRYDAKTRTSFFRDDVQLLQLCILKASDGFERSMETQSELHEEDMIVHWIKCLVYYSRDNSFSLTVGISRLLHDFRARDSRLIYEELQQSTLNIKDDDQYRRKKLTLTEKLVRRFHPWLIRPDDPRSGSYQQRNNPAEQNSIIAMSLLRLSPWNVGAPAIPDRPNRQSDGIAALDRDRSSLSDDELEILRMFTLLDPDTFSRFAESLDIGPPEDFRKLPQFVNPSSREVLPRSERGAPRKPSKREIDFLRGSFEHRQRARDKTSVGLLRVDVDHDSRVELDLRYSSVTDFSIDEDEDWLEIWDRRRQNDPVLLVSRDLSFERGSGTDAVTTRLESGQEIRLVFKRLSPGNLTQIRLEYTEKQWWRALQLRLIQGAYGMLQWLRSMWEDKETGLQPSHRFGRLNINSSQGEVDSSPECDRVHEAEVDPPQSHLKK